MCPKLIEEIFNQNYNKDAREVSFHRQDLINAAAIHQRHYGNNNAYRRSRS